LVAVAYLLSNTAQAQRPSIAALQAQITTQQSQIATLQNQVVPGLSNWTSVDESNPNRPVIRISFASLQIVNGMGSTQSANGRGNLIIGYDEPNTSMPAICSKVGYGDQTSCQNAGGTWAVNQKTGSHTIVVGPYHRYIGAVGLVAGFSNTLANDNATVSGGSANQATGQYSSVSGGWSNAASGNQSSVSGGEFNTAALEWASVSGGQSNVADGYGASISGGFGNRVSGYSATVSGGVGCSSSTDYLWIVGTLFGGCSSTLHN
jgi:hypothetical protein